MMQDALTSRMMIELWPAEDPDPEREIDLAYPGADELTYRFIKHATSTSLKEASDAKLLEGLDLQTPKLAEARERHASGDVARSLYNAVASELNRRGTVAPCFRPRLRPKSPNQKFRTKLDNLHSNDLQVLDLHWLFSRGFDPWRCGETCRPIFEAKDGSDFDLKAQLFAAHDWKMKEKCSGLGLSPKEEWMLCVIRNRNIRDEFRSLSRTAMRFRRQMEADLYSRPHQRSNLPEWPKLWLARQIAGRMLGMPEVRIGDKVSATRIAEVFSLMDGQPRSRQVIAKRTERILAYCREITWL